VVADETRTLGVPEDESTNQPTLQEILLPIWAARKRILITSVGVGILTYLINFFLFTPYFKSSATLLPETEKGRLASLGQFSDVAQKFLGENIPGSEIARLYPTVVTSETILRSVILKKYATREFKDSVNLIQYFDLTEDTPEEDMDKALRILKDLVTATTEARTGIVTITAEMPEPQLVADVLNSIISELDNFMRKKKVTTASEQLKWIDVRLKEVQVELRQAEDSLKNFREGNRRVLDSPQLLLRQDRLIRDVQVKSTIFIELKKQYELAKLEEIKNITIVNVLDPGRPPVLKERPKRTKNSIIMFLFSFFVMGSYYVVRSVYGSQMIALVVRMRDVQKSDIPRT